MAQLCSSAVTGRSGQPAGRSSSAPRGRCLRGRSVLGDTSSYAQGMTDSNGLDPEDRKIVTLARSARARNGVPEGLPYETRRDVRMSPGRWICRR